MTMVNAVLIGVPKSGSTTLADWLQEHPGVAMSRIKEPNFYASELDPLHFSPAFLRISPDADFDYWAQPDPLPRRHQAFVRQPSQYARMWPDAGPNQLRMEASKSYFWSPSAARDLAAGNPGVKALVLLRNPVDQAFSHYRMARKYGLVSGSFIEELDRDASGSASWGQRENFAALSLYADSYQRWSASGAALHTYIYEEAFQNPHAFWAEVQQDLGLSAIALPHAERVHAAHDVRWPALTAFAQHHWLGRWLVGQMPRSLKKKAIAASLATEPLRLTDTERAKAWTYFADDVARLEGLMGRNLSLWT